MKLVTVRITKEYFEGNFIGKLGDNLVLEQSTANALEMKGIVTSSMTKEIKQEIETKEFKEEEETKVKKGRPFQKK